MDDVDGVFLGLPCYLQISLYEYQDTNEASQPAPNREELNNEVRFGGLDNLADDPTKVCFPFEQ